MTWKGIQYKLILTTQDNDSGSSPLMMPFCSIHFFYFWLLFGCGSFVFYDVGSVWRQKKLLPKETVRKRSIIIINEFSAHNTFYSLFKWISLCYPFLRVWCYYPGFFLSNWLPHFNESVKIAGPVMKGGQEVLPKREMAQIDKEMLIFVAFW